MNQEEIIKETDDWLQRTWRPAVGVTYIVINVFDFIVFPILWSWISVYTKGTVEAYHPLTLEATGLFHLAFGAILGVAAWSRGQEKLAGVDTYRYRRNSRYDNPFDDVEYSNDRETSAVYRGER